MTEGEKYEIATLAQAYEDARRHAEACAMVNSRQPTEELRMKVAINYQLAKTAALKAWADLDRARRRIAGVAD
jgi:hypothetical protein